MLDDLKISYREEDAITVRLSDRTAGHTVTRIRTGHRVHPSYGRSGIALLYRVPSRMAGHTIRLTKESGSGSFMFDARLPQHGKTSARGVADFALL